MDYWSAGVAWGFNLSGELAVLKTPMVDGLPSNSFTRLDDGLSPAEVSVGGRHVVEALMVALVVDRLSAPRENCWFQDHLSTP